MDESGSYAITGRSTLKRLPARGTHERSSVLAILDEGFVCHIGMCTDDGPVVIPTSYGRVGETLYVHGSPASRMLRTLKSGVAICVTVTLVDGLVLARSAFHHSINYRSVVLFSTAKEVRDAEEKERALASIVEHVIPGRMADARPPSAKEVRSTLVLSIPIDEASAKVRSGPPSDDPDDLALPVWAGVLPLPVVAGPPDPDGLGTSVEVPAYLRSWSRAR